MADKMKEAFELLRDAKAVLANYEFSGDGEYNHDDVFDMVYRIEGFLEKVDV